MSDAALRELAAAAGLSMDWIDYRGVPRSVDFGVAQTILTALDLPCASPQQIAASRARLAEQGAPKALPGFLSEFAGMAAPLPAAKAGAPYRLLLESGQAVEGHLIPDEAGAPALPAVAECGYHRLQIGQAEMTLAVAPRRCFSLQDAVGERRLWGLTAQLYSLRRKGDGGIGDFSSLAHLAGALAARGADALAISPVHALFSADLDRYSPYSPSSRLFRNALYADPAAVFGEQAVAEAAQAAGVTAMRERLESMPLIEWPEAARAKLTLARVLYERFRQHQPVDAPVDALQREFSHFCQEGGEALRDHAVFEALHARFLGEEPKRWHWRGWPAELRNPRGAAVADFARQHAAEVGFHQFLQWLADRGLRQAQAAARGAGMALGIIGDLAVGADDGGSHAWSRQGALLDGISVGAPPDLINSVGQAWGLSAFSPQALVRQGYAPFIEMIRAALRHSGGLRIDHVLGLQRLWLVPSGVKATEGAYLRYPMEDLLRLIALESLRHRAIILGEDLGTVPEGFRERLSAAGILGLRVLWFEREWGLYLAPGRWQRDAVAMTTTHDLPPVAGWWRGRDIEWRAKLDLLGPGQTLAAEQAQRQNDRTALWNAFAYAGVSRTLQPPPEQGAAVTDAAVAYIAQSNCQLAMLPAEDLLGLDEQPNLPGTIDQHPNWRRRLPCATEDLLEQPAVAARLDLLAGSRPKT